MTCGSVVTTDIRLTSDLECSGPGSSSAPTACASTSAATPCPVPATASASTATAASTRVTIRNGTISGFLHGIDLRGDRPRSHRRRSVVTGNGRGINISRSIGMERRPRRRRRQPLRRPVGGVQRADHGPAQRRSPATASAASTSWRRSTATYDRDVVVDNELHGITISQSEGVDDRRAPRPRQRRRRHRPRLLDVRRDARRQPHERQRRRRRRDRRGRLDDPPPHRRLSTPGSGSPPPPARSTAAATGPAATAAATARTSPAAERPTHAPHASADGT